MHLTALAALALSFVSLSGAPAEPTSARMLAVLETVKPEAIHSDVTFLASDELGGRDTPSVGLETAARFLRSRLERLGWKPGAPEGYLYTYPLVQRALDEEQCALAWEVKGAKGETRTLKLGTDYFLQGLSDVADSALSAEVVFAAEGTKEDFKAVRAEGKWALVFDAGGDLRDVARNARRAKVGGLLIAPGPEYAGEPYAQRFASSMERVRRGQVSYPPKQGERGDEADRPERETFPTVLLGVEALERLLQDAKKTAKLTRGSELGPKVTETRRLKGEGGRIQVENVCGFWPGDDPELAQQVILLTAHYDHVGTRNGVVYNGADDNGSGTSTLLAVAEALAQHGPLRRSVLVMWVSGEEKGLWGSKAWSANPWLPEGCKPIADINIDMVGRNAPDKLLVTPTKSRSKDYNGLVKLAEKLAPLEGFPSLGSADEYYTRSDHYEFAQLGIPVMFLFSDVHEDYHQPGDDAEKLDYDKIRRVARLVLRVLDGLQDDKLDLKR